MSWPEWLVTTRGGLPVCRRSPIHVGPTNRDRRRVTSLTDDTNALPLSQAAIFTHMCAIYTRCRKASLQVAMEELSLREYLCSTVSRFRRHTRGHSLKLYKRHCRLDARKFFFSQRVVNSWNSLPQHVIEAPSVNSFKKRLDDYYR